ncbi:MAG: hypothetical protein L6V81_02800 [Clostridium sp.]|nr:MAG: hypothetical protein L6V81_02800 [Clostridium sp.]
MIVKNHVFIDGNKKNSRQLYLYIFLKLL